MRRVNLRAHIMRPYRRRQFRSFGDGSILHKPDWLYGQHQVEIGVHVIILSHLWLSVEREGWTRDKPTVVIGDRVSIRPYCTISAADQIVIEDNVVISGYSTVIDSDHTFDGPSPSVVWNPLRTTPVRVGRGSWIGERTSILRGANIGRFCMIGANSVVRGEIPDFSIAVGAPARVIGSTEEHTRHLVDAPARHAVGS
jgi:acetyltransferase-like isoleucine patch superfamily enzyme